MGAANGDGGEGFGDSRHEKGKRVAVQGYRAS